MRVWLASASNRRKEMLLPLFHNLQCQALELVDESSNANTVPGQILEICQKKAAAVNNSQDFEVVIVSDTMLQDPDSDDLAMGKANDAIEAAAMLHRLSGRRHRVWSATGIFYQGEWEFHLNQSIVEFDTLTDDVLVEMVLNKSWVGKAGAYDLAGPMSKYARLVEGDEATVLGIAADAMELLVSLSNYEI
ncbi:MAG: Maf family protein [Candidatus Poseidoniaceae archaeon]|nr:Maf family protein [Candidatus Poseidoniaceae archaeon]